jgi:hypothetical protein
MNNNALEEYFIWEEKNLIDHNVNLTKNEESVKENSITETKNDSIKNDWRDITDPKLRRKMYLKMYLQTYKKQWRHRNKNKIKSQNKIYYEINKEKLKAKSKMWAYANPDKVKKRKQTNRHKQWRRNYYKRYRSANLEKCREQDRIQAKKRLHENKNNIQFQLTRSLRTRLYHAINNNQKVGSAVKDLGCTIEELKIYLESKFQSGMTWDNWSKEGWHIDHIKPLSSFDLTDRNQLLKACHYTNLQPLWSQDNLVKSDNII